MSVVNNFLDRCSDPNSVGVAQRPNGEWFVFGQLLDTSGAAIPAELGLDGILGNDNGRFQWGGSGFSQCAVDVRIEPHERRWDAVILRARLQAGDGNWYDADVNLNERIGNSDGDFWFRPDGQ
ncbi:Cyanovirin-N [Xylariales sp. PMI_506]|nr:Cyanovirin-N [Xylariales sp. PMI_506]